MPPKNIEKSVQFMRELLHRSEAILRQLPARVRKGSHSSVSLIALRQLEADGAQELAERDELLLRRAIVDAIDQRRTLGLQCLGRRAIGHGAGRSGRDGIHGADAA